MPLDRAVPVIVLGCVPYCAYGDWLRFVVLMSSGRRPRHFRRHCSSGISSRGCGASGSAAWKAACSCLGDTRDHGQTNGADAPNSIIGSIRTTDHFIGRSDARIIMGDDQDALIRWWREKRGDGKPENLSDNLIVQFGTVTEVLNRALYRRSSGQTIKDTEKAAEKTHGAATAQHVGHRRPRLRALDCHRWMKVGRAQGPCRPLYQHLLLTAEKKFWRCVQSGEPSASPRPRLEAVNRNGHRYTGSNLRRYVPCLNWCLERVSTAITRFAQRSFATSLRSQLSNGSLPSTLPNSRGRYNAVARYDTGC